MSLKQIAEMVGTSPSTVSRVLNQTSPGCASKELQKRIWEAARLTGYQPNEAARSLRQGKSPKAKTDPYHISIFMARFRELSADPFFKDLLHCLEAELYEQGVLLDKVIYREDELTNALSSTDGIIVLGRCTQTLLEQMQRKNRNIVGIWRNSMNFAVDEVICDGKKAAQMALEYLISLGHRNIAYIGDCTYECRYEGYNNTLIQHGIPLDYRLIKATDQTYEQGRHAILELLESDIRFSAVFCANDITASSVLQVLDENKQYDSRHISVISIDDIEGLWEKAPYLTTVRIPRQGMAHMALMLLLDRIRRKHEEILRIEFPCKLIEMDSCTPPVR